MNLSWFCIFMCRSVRGFAVQLLMNLPIVILHRVLMSCQYSFHSWLFANPVITSKGLDHPGATQQQLHSTFAPLSLDPAASLESEIEQTRRSSRSHKIAYIPKSVSAQLQGTIVVTPILDVACSLIINSSLRLYASSRRCFSPEASHQIASIYSHSIRPGAKLPACKPYNRLCPL